MKRNFTKYPQNNVSTSHDIIKASDTYHNAYDNDEDSTYWRTDIRSIDDVIDEINQISHVAGTNAEDVLDHLDDLLNRQLITQEEYDSLAARTLLWQQNGYQDLF